PESQWVTFGSGVGQAAACRFLRPLTRNLILSAKPNQQHTSENKEKSALVPTSETRAGKPFSHCVGGP
ncbi:MAG: hypothetical protein E6575_06670, partial [Bradyrhizobium sp.]|nr:hypothetical protein [Bradyrhizobium sp.]